MTLRGRCLVITGAAGGLGSALVRGALDRGASVWATDRSDAELGVLRDALPASGERLRLVAADLSDATAAATMAAHVLEHDEAIDGLINNAAVLIPKPIAAVSVQDFDLQVAVNLRAPFVLSQVFAEASLRRGRPCHVVNVLSGAARTGGLFDSIVYGATKGGLLAMTKGFARSYGPRGLRFNAIAPTAMNGPMSAYLTPEQRASFVAQVPLRRFSEPSEVAAAGLWLLSDEASFITGATLDASGGWTMI